MDMNNIDTETKKCKHCQMDIPKKAKRCPHCRKKQGGKAKWIIIGIVVVLFIAIATSGEDEPTAKKVGTADSSGNSKTDSDSKNKDSGDEASAPKNEFHVGDIVETDTLKISYISVEDYISDNEFIQPKDGYKYVKAVFEFENISDSDEYVSSFDFSCYADGYDMEQSYFDEMKLDATLSPGRKSQGAIFFEVPVDAQEVIFEYETNFWSEDKVIFYR